MSDSAISSTEHAAMVKMVDEETASLTDPEDRCKVINHFLHLIECNDCMERTADEFDLPVSDAEAVFRAALKRLAD